MKCNMAMSSVIVLCLLALPCANAEQSNPLSKVISLLASLKAKVTAEGEAEAKAYKEYFEWCDEFSRNKQFDIKTATSQKEKLEAEIAKQTGNSDASAAKIEELAASIATDEKELKDATLIRDKETKEFEANEAELLSVIGTLGRAINILSREMAKNPAAFAQIDTSNVKSLLVSMT